MKRTLTVLLAALIMTGFASCMGRENRPITDHNSVVGRVAPIAARLA